MENYLWKNDEYNTEIKLIYSNFQHDLKKIFYEHCGLNIEQKIIQHYPNEFSLCGLKIELFYNNFTNSRTYYLLKFPEVEIFNGTILPGGPSENKILQKLYTVFLDSTFDYKSFRIEIEKCTNHLVEKYINLTTNNFYNIRRNFFKDFQLYDFEKEYFSIPNVLLEYTITENISSYGYKKGEGRNFQHSFHFSYKNIIHSDNIFLKKYIEKLNNENPKYKYSDMYETSAIESGVSTDREYYALDLSKKINRYLVSAELNSKEAKFDDFNGLVDFKQEQNHEIFFENLIIIYVIVTQNISVILEFLSNSSYINNESYKNLVLLSEYFLNKKFRDNQFIYEFYKIRELFIQTVNKKNFKNKNYYESMRENFEKLIGITNDFYIIQYFYINYSLLKSDDYDDIDYTNILYVFYKYFNKL